MKILVDFAFYVLSKDIICLQPFLPTKNAYKHRCVHSRSTSRQFYSLLHPKQYRAEPRVCIIPWIYLKIHILFPWLQQNLYLIQSSSLQSLRVTSRKQGGIRRRSLLKSRFQSIFVPVQFSQSRDRRSSSPIVYICFAENLSVRALRLELIINSRRTEQSVSAFSNVPISKAFNWDSSPFA